MRRRSGKPGETSPGSEVLIYPGLAQTERDHKAVISVRRTCPSVGQGFKERDTEVVNRSFIARVSRACVFAEASKSF